MLTELSLDTRLDRSLRGVIELYVCKNSEVSCFQCLIGQAVKTYDYINRVVLTLPLSVYEGTWTRSPLSLLCITMILRVRRIFFEITTFPNSGIRARFMCRCYMHEYNTSELWPIQVILLTSMSHFGSAVLLDEAARTTLRVRLRETGFTAVLCTQVTSGCQFLQL